MTRHAKASSAGSTQGRSSRSGSFVRGALATRDASSDANGSGARPIGAAPIGLLIVLCFSLAAMLAVLASPALAAQTHPYTGTSFGPDGVGGTESFERVQSLAVDPANGDTYVYDGGAGKVYKFDSAGAPVNFSATGTNAISGVGGGAGAAEYEIALAPAGSPAGTAGDIYVAINGQAIHVYSPAGVELGVLEQGGETCGVATDPSGNLYAGVYSKTINKFTPSANPPVGTDKTGTGTVEQGICNVAADGLGNVYAASYNGSQGLFKLEGIADTTPTLIDSAANTMAIAPGSNDLYADHEKEVFQYDSSGTPIGSFANGDISGSHGVAVNSGASKIYVGIPTKVKVFGPATTVPDAITEAADAITKTAATLHGTVGAAGGPDATCVFQYTSASAYNEHGFEGASEASCNPAGPFSGSGTTPVSATATGLSAETGYRFRLLASSSNGSYGGAVRSFSTPGAVNLLTDPATNITSSGATLNGTINPEGIELEECAFEYRSGFGSFEKASCAESPSTIGSGNTPVPVHLDLTGLTGGTEYQFRLVGKNELGTNQGADESFKVKGPSLGSESFGGVTESSVTFHASIDPNGADTSYVFEYVTQADFESNGFAGAASVPVGGEDIGAGTADVEVSTTAKGLEPRSAYRFRVVATSVDGATRGTATSFATYPAQPSFGSCPNDRFRTGPSAELPDCRAYEQATPVDKTGSDVSGNTFAVQASSSGDAITSYTFAGFPGPESFLGVNVLMSRFDGGKWSTAGLSSPYSYGNSGGTQAWTSDLRLSFGNPRHTDGAGGSSLVMRDSVDGSRTVIIPQGVGFGEGAFTLGGAFDEDSKVVFEANGAVPVTSGPAPVSTERNVYLYDRDTGALTLVGVLPDSACASPPCVPATGSKLPLAFGGFAQEGHVVTTDGDVYFTDSSGELYLRRDAAGPGATTVQVSASHKTNGGGTGGVASNSPQPLSYFYGATPNGSKAFFTSNEELTNDANTGPELPPLTTAIGRANIDGSSPQPSFIPTTAKWTAVDSSLIYWTNTKAGTIGRANIDGTNAEPSFISGLENPEGIAVDSGHIYWAEARDHAEGHGTIGRATLAGGSVEKEFVTGAGDPHGVAVSSEYVYWTNGASTDIGRATITGANPEQSFLSRGGGEHPWGIAVNATNLYWIDQEEGEAYVFKVNVGGGGENFAYVSGEPRGIAIDPSHIYWSDVSNSRIGRRGLSFENSTPEFITGRPGIFGISVDASHVYWATNASGITLPPSPGNDLYRYDRESGGLIDLVPDSSDPNGAQVIGVLGSSDDGDRVYFAANGDLDGSGPAASGDCSPGQSSNGSCSVYLWQAEGTGACPTAGGCISFVARVDAFDNEGNWWGGPASGNELSMKVSRVSSDGSTLIFSSQHRLTAYENQGTREFYRYDAGSGQISCPTCNPTGAPPTGAPELKNGNLFHAPTTALTYRAQAFLSRNLSPDGKRFFFQSPDKLVSGDVNGEVKCDSKEETQVGSGPSCLDAYEWEAPGDGSCTENGSAYSPANGGCIYLLSTGTGPYPSYLADVSESGDTAFIFSRQQLVPADEDVQEDIYAVKVDGGLAADHEARPANCEGDACRGASSKPSSAPGAGTAAFEGPGNPKSNINQTRCPKGKRTVHSKGKVRCVAKHKKAHKHKSKSHKRAANTNRRASR